MLHTYCIILCAQVFLFSRLCVAGTVNQQILGPQAPLRNATLSDADDIASIVMAAFEPMPDWRYFYQFRHAFPQGHRECVRHGITQMLTNPNTNTEVIEAPKGSDIPLVAMAVWMQNNSSSFLFERGAPGKCTGIGARVRLMEDRGVLQKLKHYARARLHAQIQRCREEICA